MRQVGVRTAGIDKMQQQNGKTGVMTDNHDVLVVTAMRLDRCQNCGGAGLIDTVRKDC